LIFVSVFAVIFVSKLVVPTLITWIVYAKFIPAYTSNTTKPIATIGMVLNVVKNGCGELRYVFADKRCVIALWSPVLMPWINGKFATWDIVVHNGNIKQYKKVRNKFISKLDWTLIN
jgi:hypothetical protein